MLKVLWKFKRNQQSLVNTKLWQFLSLKLKTNRRYTQNVEFTICFYYKIVYIIIIMLRTLRSEGCPKLHFVFSKALHFWTLPTVYIVDSSSEFTGTPQKLKFFLSFKMINCQIFYYYYFVTVSLFLYFYRHCTSVYDLSPVYPISTIQSALRLMYSRAFCWLN